MGRRSPAFCCEEANQTGHGRCQRRGHKMLKVYSSKIYRSQALMMVVSFRWTVRGML